MSFVLSTISITRSFFDGIMDPMEYIFFVARIEWFLYRNNKYPKAFWCLLIYRIYFVRNILYQKEHRNDPTIKSPEFKNLTCYLSREIGIYCRSWKNKFTFIDDSFGVSTPEHDNVVGHAQAKDVSAEENNGRVPRWSHRCPRFLNTYLIRQIFENSILGISLYDPPFFLNAVKKKKSNRNK